MKRILLVLSMVLLTLGVMSAQEKNGAVIAVEGNSTHDFGDVKEADGPVTHTFVVKNTGNAPLILTNVQSSCGCTTPSWTKEPIAPGKTGKIDVTFDVNGRPGAFTKTVSIYSNGKTGSFVLTIKGNVISK